jgi:predicted Zn-dependent protease
LPGVQRPTCAIAPWLRAAALAGLCAALLLASAPRAADRELATPYDDEAVGAEVARQAAAQFGIVEDEELNAYVTAVGRRLARHAPGYAFDYRFAIVDDPTPNAFALPGGYVFVSRGLLALSNSEDELAGVLGHEIAHAALRHSAARQRTEAGAGLLQPFKIVQVLAFSRDLEHSADRVGQGLAGVAGYDPAGITSFLQSLDAVDRLRLGASRLPSFLDTHPGTATRVADTAQRAEGISWKRVAGEAAGRPGHLRRLDGVVVGVSASQGVFRGTRFVHPDLGFTLRFPDRWRTQNTARAVGATSPDGRAQVYLEHGGPGGDPAAAAAEWAKEGAGHGLRIDAREPIKLYGRKAYRLTGALRGRGGSVELHATFLPWRGQIYRLVGASASLRRHDPIFSNVARSFRSATPELLAEIRETRVRLVEAQPGETLDALARRSDSAWPSLRVAVLNGVQPSHAFQGGELVKVARAEPYRPPESAAAARGAGR